MKVTELMTRPAVTCHVDDTLSCAAQLMWDHDCGAIPVVNGDGRVVGVITDRDICMAAWSQGSTLHAIPVASAMSNRLVACRATDTLDVVRAVMREKQVRRVPVVDAEDRPVGVLSINDVARTAATTGTGERDLARLFASIGAPRLARPGVAPVAARPAAGAAPAAAS